MMGNVDRHSHPNIRSYLHCLIFGKILEGLNNVGFRVSLCTRSSSEPTSLCYHTWKIAWELFGGRSNHGGWNSGDERERADDGCCGPFIWEYPTSKGKPLNVRGLFRISKRIWTYFPGFLVSPGPFQSTNKESCSSGNLPPWIPLDHYPPHHGTHNMCHRQDCVGGRSLRLAWRRMGR